MSVGDVMFKAGGYSRTWLHQIGGWFRRRNNRLISGHIQKRRISHSSKGSFEKTIRSGQPFVAGKIGTAELLALEFHDRRIRIPCLGLGWRRSARRLATNAGFFPLSKRAFVRWNVIMRKAISQMDFICAWQGDEFLKTYESRLIASLNPKATIVGLESVGMSMLPEIASSRWLVISPFVDSMRAQLPRLGEVHHNSARQGIDWKKISKNCRFLRCPLHWHLAASPFSSWKEGLDRLAEAAAVEDFDVALIGAGAWSLPLAARIKQTGRSAIHTGGETQLIFGIRGKRWDDYNFYNSAWISPSPEETPQANQKIDDGCYW